MHFFRRGMERFDLRREDNILRGEDGFANGEGNGRDGGSVLGDEFDWIGAWDIGHGYGHQAEPLAIGLLEKTHRAAVEPRGGSRNFATKPYGLAQRDRRGLYGALLRAGCRTEHCG